MRNMVDLLRTSTVSETGHYSTPAAICRFMLERMTDPVKIIEIGTAYGEQLKYFAPLASKVICVDAMYDWVPDIGEETVHDGQKVDQAKVDRWYEATRDFSEKVELVVGNSFHVHSEEMYASTFAGADILIVDGCHHPGSAVANDYINFKKFMKMPHYVIFDDMEFDDCKTGAEMARNRIETEGQSTDWIDVKAGCSTARVMYVKASV